MNNAHAGGGDFSMPQQQTKHIVIENNIPPQPGKNYLAEAVIGLVIALAVAVIVKTLIKK